MEINTNGDFSIAPGKFEGNLKSLTSQFECPEWFKDAKSDSGHIGDRNRFPCTATGTRAGCTWKAIPTTIIIAGNTDIRRSLDTRI